MGGAETWLIEVLRFLAQQGDGAIQMDFLATSGRPGLFDEEARALGANVFYLAFNRAHVAEFTSGLREILKRGHYTVLHDHQGFASGWHFLFASGVLPPVRIAHFHNAAYQVHADLRSRRLMTSVGGVLVKRYATHILGASRELLVDYGFMDRRLVSIPKGPLYCGFNVERFAGPREPSRDDVRREFGWPADARIVLLAGRMDRSASLDDTNNCKNTAFSVEVGLTAARRDPRIRLLFAGQLSPAAVALEERIAATGLTDRFRFAGIRLDIERLMAASDVLLFPSRGEGLGLVAVEAQAAGLPVLASTGVPHECVVLPELVRFRNLEAGPEAWAEDLLQLVAQPRDQRDANGAVRASAFSIEQSAKSLRTLYTTLSIGAEECMRVLQVVDTLGMGGAETWIMEALRHLRRNGGCTPQIDFLATSGKSGIFDEEARALGAKVHYLRFGRSQVGEFARGFRQILKRGGYTAIHDHQAFASGWHFLLGLGLLPRVRITHVHNPAYQVMEQPWGRRVLNGIGARLVGRYATHVAATSSQVLDEYGFGADRFRKLPRGALYCGFDPERFRRDRPEDRCSVRHEFGWPADAKIVLFAGRLDQSPDFGDPLNHKNSGLAVSIGIEAAQRDPRIRLLFAGQPSQALGMLNARIDAVGLTDRFVFAGIRKDIERLMAGSDALLFPSRGEGLGMVVVEAQAAGLPVLASSAVPRECVVVSRLVRFLDLTAPVEAWATDLLEMVDWIAAGDGNRQVTNSHFAIRYSADALCRLYASEAAS